MNIPLVEVTEQPRWIEELTKQCSTLGRAKVSEKIGYGKTVISQVLNDKYPGNLEEVEKAVRGAFMGDTVMCPILDEIGLNLCQQYHKNKPSTVNPTRVRLARTCPNCEHNSAN